MPQILLKIYIKNRRLPFATAILSSEKQLEQFYELLNDNSLHTVIFHDIVFAKSEFRYARITRK